MKYYLDYQGFENRIFDHEDIFLKMRMDLNYFVKLNEVINLLVDTLKNNNKILICGNGGSASDAQHLTAEFVSRFKKERQALSVIALTTNTSILTAIGNDYSFDVIFKRQVEALGNSNDVLIGFSTSGNSNNIVEALNQAKKQGLKTVLFTGNGKDLKCEEYSDYTFKVPSLDTARIQEGHVFLYHLLAEFVEKEF